MPSAQRPEAPGGHAAAHAPLAGRTGAPSHGADSRGRRRAAFGTGGESWADPRAPGGPEAPVPPSRGPRARRPCPRRGPSLPASSGVPVLRGAAGWASRRVTGWPADPGSPCLGRVRRAGGISPGLGARSAAVWRHPRACWRLGVPFPAGPEAEGRRLCSRRDGWHRGSGPNPVSCHLPALCPWTRLSFFRCDEEQITSTSGYLFSEGE